MQDRSTSDVCVHCDIHECVIRCVCVLLLQDLLQSCSRATMPQPWTGTREELGTFKQGAPVFPGSSRLGIEPGSF